MVGGALSGLGDALNISRVAVEPHHPLHQLVDVKELQLGWRQCECGAPVHVSPKKRKGGGDACEVCLDVCKVTACRCALRPSIKSMVQEKCVKTSRERVHEVGPPCENRVGGRFLDFLAENVRKEPFFRMAS